MKAGFWNLLVLVLLPISVVVVTGDVQATRGLPGTPEFGFGALVYPQGPGVPKAMEMAVDLELDWIQIPVEWKAYQPNLTRPIQLDALDLIMNEAERNGIAVLLSLSDPPAWAMTRSGPDAEHAARFLLAVADRYPGALRAVELFPGANTRKAWGAKPDPQTFLNLFNTIDETLLDHNVSVLMVAGGFRPLSFLHPADDIDDLEFLQTLYNLGASQSMPVISLQFPEMTGEPLLLPGERDLLVLRHYEEVRRLMVMNYHQEGLIWVTHLSLPSGTISIADSGYHDQKVQSVWLSQAYIQLRSQLYIGVAFLQSLNTLGEGSAEKVPSLLSDTGELHPFYPVLQEIIYLNQTGYLDIKPGKSKEGNFEKMRP